MNIKLRRSFEGQDSWCAFVEEVGFDFATKKLAYRRSSGGNCERGQWDTPWSDEKEALEFLLGPVPITPEIRDAVVSDILQLPDLEDNGLDYKAVINYGGY